MAMSSASDSSWSRNDEPLATLFRLNLGAFDDDDIPLSVYDGIRSLMFRMPQGLSLSLHRFFLVIRPLVIETTSGVAHNGVDLI